MTTRTTGAQRFVPPAGGLERLREAASDCEGCPLFQAAERTVFGAGDERSRVVVVGEQPGSVEDHEGRPYADEAGELLDGALEQAGIDPAQVYRTYAVKHYKFVRVGTTTHGASVGRRVRLKPSRGEREACRPWLLAELNTIDPELVICLGGTAAHSLLGAEFQVSAHRGVVHLLAAPELRRNLRVMVTMRPESVARLRESDRRDAFAEFLVDLRHAAEMLRHGTAA
ncbi:uracil-DNA glycosylase [Glycomyces sp. TRM65418]|uniref:uracil-DNA glycosylase n=1 Tax=Glycomyces sp. TRM65418 TaxID=2867006 RepID=UPI001CE618BF|nr:uracil-DNA glycosylase [Glycomyces sp. TRM65418]MCC3762051.1 uracil-DNA glycosylase [Glycomyces sp. TRM65418]QZD56122.1 uracil-DNA glycosylase [Glycomyces sp. TRM65418]